MDNTRTPQEIGWIVFNNACPCDFCKGTEPPPPSEGWAEHRCSGRHPFVIQYDPARFKVEHMSSNQCSRYRPEEEFPDMVAVFETSSHGCWKIRKHQLAVLVKKS